MKTGIASLSFLALVVAAVVWNYNIRIIERNFTITDHVPCNPAQDSCFTAMCDSGMDGCEVEPYMKLQKKASAVQVCQNFIQGSCPALTCAPEEEGCTITTCSNATIEKGEVCYSEPSPSNTPIEADI